MRRSETDMPSSATRTTAALGQLMGTLGLTLPWGLRSETWCATAAGA